MNFEQRYEAAENEAREFGRAHKVKARVVTISVFDDNKTWEQCVVAWRTNGKWHLPWEFSELMNDMFPIKERDEVQS